MNFPFLYCERQVSRLIASGFDSSASVSFPVSQWIIPLLAKYGDELVQDSHLLPVNFGQPISHRYYVDSTTYMMGVVKDLIAPFDEEGRPHKPEILLPDDNDLIGQLSCRKYSFTSNSKQKVESKKDMKDRGLTSPDEADCILLVCLPMTYKKKGGKK